LIKNSLDQKFLVSVKEINRMNPAFFYAGKGLMEIVSGYFLHKSAKPFFKRNLLTAEPYICLYDDKFLDIANHFVRIINDLEDVKIFLVNHPFFQHGIL